MIDPHEAAETLAARLAKLGLALQETVTGRLVDKSTNRYGQKSAYLRAGGVSATGRRFVWDIRVSDHSSAGSIAHIDIILPSEEMFDEAIAHIEAKLAL